MKIEVNKPCFICGSEESELVFEKEYREHGYPGRFAMRKCKGCSLLFNSPRLSDEEISALYRSSYYFFNRNDKMEFIRIAEVYNRTISLVEHRFSSRKVLEIGSAKGYLLAVLKCLGWEVHGVEISTSAARYAEMKFKVPVYAGTVDEYVRYADRGKFPLVLAIDVLEHVPYPDRFLSSVYEVLERDGVLIIDTPNGSSYNISTERWNWKGFNPYHVFLFSKENIGKLLTANGFATDIVFSYGNGPRTISESGDHVQKEAVKRRIKRTLDKLGLLGLTQTAYHGLMRIADRVQKKGNYVLQAVEKIRNAPPYLETIDSKGPLASGGRGDNLVVIARKGHSA